MLNASVQAAAEGMPASNPAMAVPAPSHVRAFPDTYALLVAGSCMAGAAEDGECVIVDTKRKPEAGDLVAIWPVPGSRIAADFDCSLKRLLIAPPDFAPAMGWTELDRVVMVEQNNPPRVFAVSARKIRAMHVVSLVLPGSEVQNGSVAL